MIYKLQLERECWRYYMWPILVYKPSFRFLYKPYIGYIVTLREDSKNVVVKGFRV